MPYTRGAPSVIDLSYRTTAVPHMDNIQALKSLPDNLPGHKVKVYRPLGWILCRLSHQKQITLWFSGR